MLRTVTAALRRSATLGVRARHLAVMPSKTPLPALPPMSLTELLFSRTSKFGDAPALIDGPTGRTILYSEIVSRG